MIGLFVVLKDGIEPLAQSVVMAPGPVYPSALIANMKARMTLPHVVRHQPFNRIPAHRFGCCVAGQAPAEWLQVVRLDIQFTNHLDHLMLRGVVPDKDHKTAFTSPLDRFCPCQDHATGINGFKKIFMAIFVLTSRIESGRTQLPTQFSQCGIRCKTHHCFTSAAGPE
jgi:hypothetical protein